MPMSILPPPQYDFPPPMPVYERVLPWERVYDLCIDLGVTSWPAKSQLKNHPPLGCSIREKDGVCSVWIADVAQQETVRRHEYAHCNGWPNNHPGMR